MTGRATPVAGAAPWDAEGWSASRACRAGQSVREHKVATIISIMCRSTKKGAHHEDTAARRGILVAAAEADRDGRGDHCDAFAGSAEDHRSRGRANRTFHPALTGLPTVTASG